MKINFAQLFTHLNQQLSPIYLISGDESLLVDEAKNIIYQAAASKGFEHREVLYAEPGFDWQTFAQIAYNLSLFTVKQIIELRLPNGKPTDIGSKALVEYAQNSSPDNILVIIAPKLDAAIQKSKWVKTIEQNGILIPIWPLEPKNLLVWIANKTRQHGCSISSNGCKIIAEFTAGNLLATQQEIEKLSLLYGNSTITDEQILTALSDSSHFNVFNLVDAVYAQNAAQAINILQHLQTENVELTLVLWAMARMIRLLIQCKSVCTDQATLNQILNNYANKLKIEHKTQIKQLLPKLQLKKLECALQFLGDIDQIIKGVKSGNAWLELQKMIISIK